MCCFTQPVQSVSGTRIFARLVDGWQVIVYSMTVATAHDNAMVLPVPVEPGLGEESIRFVSLLDYPTFFDDMQRSFVLQPGPPGLAFAPPGAAMEAPLVVHDVGDFQASCVPTLRDFARLDERFRLNPAVLQVMPQYADYGFAVFKLRGPNRLEGPPPVFRIGEGPPVGGPLCAKCGEKVAAAARFCRHCGAPQPIVGFLRSLGESAVRKMIHPMAFFFKTSQPERLFYPTLHIHDGHIATDALFDHTLYCQMPGAVPGGWVSSHGAASRHMNMERTNGLVDPDEPLHRREMRGLHANIDLLIPV